MEQLRWLFLEAFLLAFLMVYFLLPKACRAGLVDRPRGRKRHARAVPLIGGLAIYAAYAVSLGPVGLDSIADALLLAGGALLVLIGALDDYFDFPAWPRLVTQTLAAGFMVGAGVVVADLGQIGPDGRVLSLGLLAVPFTLIGAVGIINAFNMSDGIDGLSGCLSLVAIAGLGGIAVAGGADDAAQALVILAGCVSGFLAYNLRSPLRRSAAVFLGDAGSMFLGFALTWFLVVLSQGQDAVMPPASAPWLVALPIMDTLYSILRRLATQRSPLAPDNQHLHHLLMERGYSVAQTVTRLTLTAAVMAGVGVAGALFNWHEWFLLSGFATVFLLYSIGVTALWLGLDRRSRRRDLSGAGGRGRPAGYPGDRPLTEAKHPHHG